MTRLINERNLSPDRYAVEGDESQAHKALFTLLIKSYRRGAAKATVAQRICDTGSDWLVRLARQVISALSTLKCSITMLGKIYFGMFSMCSPNHVV